MGWQWSRRNITVDGQWVAAVEGREDLTDRIATIYAVENEGHRWQVSAPGGKKASGVSPDFDAAKKAAELACRKRGRPRVGATALSSTERSRRSRSGLAGTEQAVAQAVQRAMDHCEWRPGRHDGDTVLMRGEKQIAAVTPFAVTVEYSGFRGSLTRRVRDGDGIDDVGAKAVAEVMVREILKATFRT